MRARGGACTAHGLLLRLGSLLSGTGFSWRRPECVDGDRTEEQNGEYAERPKAGAGIELGVRVW